MARILVTGGAGFIGSHTVELLVEHGHNVTVFDDLSSGSRANLASVLPVIKLVHGDVCDGRALNRVAAAGKFDTILHLAAIVSVRQSIRYPVRCHAVNLTGTLNVLEAAHSRDVPRVVIASSAAVYGNSDVIPSSEASSVRPISHYGVQKLAGEQYAQAYAHLHGMETIALRYFNVFGPRQDADSPYSGVISRFVAMALAERTPTIYGDGQQTRDFIYVGDVARANVAALTGPVLRGDVVNVASGFEHSVLEVWQSISEAMGREPVVNFEAPREGDINRSCADVQRLRTRLDMCTAWTLREGLTETIVALPPRASRWAEREAPVPHHGSYS